MHEPRIGDTIISKRGVYYTVESKDKSTVAALPSEEGMTFAPRHKYFRPDSLHCVDYDDGLWQEVEPR